MSDDIIDQRSRQTEADEEAEQERLSKLPGYERDSATEIGGGILNKGGTAGDTGTGTVVNAGTERDEAADQRRPVDPNQLPDRQLDEQSPGWVATPRPPEAGGSQ